MYVVFSLVCQPGMNLFFIFLNAAPHALPHRKKGSA